jgi:ribokinase
MDLVDLLVVNEIEASDLLDAKVTPASAADATKRLATDVTRGCVLTMGSLGIVAHVDGEPHRLDGHSVKAIDTTGAGDAFCGAMAAALATDHSVRTALAWGNAAGALAATRPGAQPSMPARQEIEQYLQRTLD